MLACLNDWTWGGNHKDVVYIDVAKAFDQYRIINKLSNCKPDFDFLISF